MASKCAELPTRHYPPAAACLSLAVPHLPAPALQYGATAIALLIYAAPLYWSGARSQKQGSQGEITQDYISAMRLLSNTSK